MSNEMIRINKAALRESINRQGLKLCEASQLIGKSPSYFATVLGNRESSGQIAATALLLWCSLMKEDPEKLKEKAPKPEPVPVPVGSASSPVGYSLDLDVRPDKVRVGLYHNGALLYEAWSRIRGKTEMNLAQAISYATHMIYKQAEQDLLAR